MIVPSAASRLVGAVVPLALSAALVLSGCQELLTHTPADGEEGFVAATELPDSAGSTALEFPEVDPSMSDPMPIELGEAGQIVASWTLEEKIASLFVIHIEGVNLANFQTAVQDAGVGGFLILGNNIPRDSGQTRELLESVRQLGDPELLIAIDQEGGAVQRLRPDPLPGAEELGQGELDTTTEVTRERAQLVWNAGGNVNLGIVADVSPGDDAYIHSRSFGQDPTEVAQHVGAALDGRIDGVAVAVKHFPGHGLTAEDTHRVIARSAISLGNWFNQHAPPFAVAVDRDVEMVMLGHMVVPAVEAVPASLSREWVAVLRQQWAYDGVVITDDLSMLEDTGDERYESFPTNARAAIAAGADIVLDAGGTTLRVALERVDAAVAEITQAVEAGEIDPAQIDQSAIRVLELRLSLGGVSRPLENSDAG